MPAAYLSNLALDHIAPSAVTLLRPSDLAALAPLVVLVVTALLLLLVGGFLPRAEVRVPAALSLCGVAGAAYLLAAHPAGGVGQVVTREVTLPGGIARTVGLLRHDAFAAYLTAVLLLCAAATVLLAADELRRHAVPRGEFFPLVLLATAAMGLAVMADDLILLFLAIETFSLALYVLVAVRRGDRSGHEAALKYFVLGSIAAAMFLYGAALLYAASGSTNLSVVADALATGAAGTSPTVLAGAVLLLGAVGFKASLVPFHQWTPDVYEGAPTSVSAFMSAATKVTAFAVLARVLWSAVSVLAPLWVGALASLAVLTMLVGNLAALVQHDMKRMLGYSAVAHAGYVLVGVLIGSVAGVGAALFYLLVYAVMSLGAFGAFVVVGPVDANGREASRLDDLRGLARDRPWIAACLAVCLLGLTGMPPTAGFLGKWYLFQAAVGEGWTPLALAIVANSVLSAFYYLRPILYMFAGEPTGVPHRRPGVASGIVVALAGIVTAVALVVTAPWIEAARAAGAVGTVETATPSSGRPPLVLPMPGFVKGRN